MFCSSNTYIWSVTQKLEHLNSSPAEQIVNKQRSLFKIHDYTNVQKVSDTEPPVVQVWDTWPHMILQSSEEI